MIGVGGEVSEAAKTYLAPDTTWLATENRDPITPYFNPTVSILSSYEPTFMA